MEEENQLDAIEELKKDRDYHLRKLWLIFRDMRDYQQPEDFTEEDADLWEKLTLHSAIQNKLRTVRVMRVYPKSYDFG